ncbi:glucosamine 6-phosphate synthetase-like protein [Desulfotignum phosphitoxidans DSM 13687]|uniref:Glucosamine 6-phosphate synthetase-like protein n=1 Tax=Desulfotignum phosphitoxidans DSM 13687 TaxID=1286635 RepID=S0FQS7_9BACT|nr:glucosamine 6-phosphate synthetase-like protein [Desulfotignum phosphitoxidans DSM 13687]
MAWLFTRLLVLSESRGPHATGMAWLNRDGEHRLFKRPVSAGQFVIDKAFHEVLAGIDNRTTVLLGHTRWRTRGDERVNRNNHPIRAGDVIGTHNGTIYNADYLFRRFKLRRFAEVDSELLFRLAARAARSGRMDVEWFKERLRHCRGQMTAVLASRLDPETILVLKGNKPLELRIHRRHPRPAGSGRGCPRPWHFGRFGRRGHTGAVFRTVGLIRRTDPAKRHSGRLGPRVRGASHLRRSRVPPARHRPPGGVPLG